MVTTTPTTQDNNPKHNNNNNTQEIEKTKITQKKKYKNKFICSKINKQIRVATI